MKPTTEELRNQAEQISNEFEDQLKEMIHWFGGADELKKIIDKVQDQLDEAAFDRYCEDKPQNGEIV
jgi:uncharacterized coiled-coil DUF342 family protein